MTVGGIMIGFLLFASETSIGPLEDQEILDKAQSAFRNGMDSVGRPEALTHFLRSARAYEELNQRGFRNASLFLNEGNAFFLADDLPRAILAYRRGLRLDPDDRELRGNLDHARSQVAYASWDQFGRPPIEHWPSWLPHGSIGARLVLAILFYSLACASFTRWLMTRRAMLMLVSLASFMITLFPTATLTYDEIRRRDDLRHPLVVVASDGATLFKGDGYRYPPRYEIPLNRGTEARLLFLRDNWIQVELSGGEVGWLPLAEAWVDE